MSLQQLVGIPYSFRGDGESGIDCYQLVFRGLKELFGVEPPNYLYSGDPELYAETMRDRSREWERVDSPEPGDVIMFRLGTKLTHCGLVIRPGFMLHTIEGRNSCIEGFNTISWRHRILGFYRWQS